MDVNIYPTDNRFGGDFMNFCIREAKVNLPEWYRKSSSYTEKVQTPYEKDHSMTMKKCIPILDYLSSGLNLHLPFALYGEGKYPNRKIVASLNDPDCKLSGHHPDQRQGYPVSDKYDPVPLKIDFPYTIEAPRGYSALFIGISDDANTPLLFPPAIVETDKYLSQVNFPFFIKKEWEGKIDAGALFMKVIFVRREDFKINYLTYEDAKGRNDQHGMLVKTFGAGFYKKLKLDKFMP